MFAVRQAFEHDRFLDALFRELDELESHDALVGGECRNCLIDVMAIRLVKIRLEFIAHRIEVQRQQHLERLKERNRRFVDVEIEVVTESSSSGVSHEEIETQSVCLLVCEVTGRASFQPRDDWIEIYGRLLARLKQGHPVDSKALIAFLR